VIKRGEYFRVSGEKYGSYDGEIGCVYGDTTPIKGKPAVGVDMGDVLIAALEEDCTVVDNPKAKKIKRVEASKT
jgi:hypothetical protein